MARLGDPTGPVERAAGRRAPLIRRLALALATGVVACDGEPCRRQADCPLGSYCVLDTSSTRISGSCQRDCLDASDCPAPASMADRAICDNDGRCAIVARLPRLRVRSPERGASVAAGERSLRVEGEVVTAAPAATVSVEALGPPGCPGGPPRRVRLPNDSGAFRALPFLVDALPVDPFVQSVVVTAETRGAASRRRSVELEGSCPGCDLAILSPVRGAAPQAEVSTRLVGRTAPGATVVWRVVGEAGGRFDGSAPVDASGRFEAEGLPVLAGDNRVEVVAFGVGGRAQLRCTTFVRAPGIERGLRLVLTWDTPATDLDLHVVLPGGRFGQRGEDLSPRTPAGVPGGAVRDDFDGFGPELATFESPPEGVFGLVVEAVSGRGSATLRAFLDGAPLTEIPLGPRFVDAERADLWVAAQMVVDGAGIAFVPLGDLLSAAAPPRTAPEAWPAYR